MEAFIKEYLAEYSIGYITIPEYDLEQIYNLYHNNISCDKLSPNTMNYYGIYYFINNDCDKMLKYYLMAIDKGNDAAMDNLGTDYFRNTDYHNAINII